MSKTHHTVQKDCPAGEFLPVNEGKISFDRHRVCLVDACPVFHAGFDRCQAVSATSGWVLRRAKVWKKFRSQGVDALGDDPARRRVFVSRWRHVVGDGGIVLMSSTEPDRQPASRRVLVIDDDHDVADSLVIFLETFGACARAAYNCETGVVAVREFRPDLVFLDLGMPKIDGYETARRIRALPEGRGIKLVALTGWGQEQIQDRAREAGFDCQLTKPAGIEALQALLDTV
jgi:CheY-like chemotaxis protein